MVIQYASIHDAWDQSAYAAKDSSKPKRKKVDPSCDLLKQRYDSEEKSQVMNSYFDDIPFEKYEKAYKASHREKRDRHVDIKPSQSFYDVSEEFDQRGKTTRASCKSTVQPYGQDEYDASFGYDQYFETQYTAREEAEEAEACDTLAEEKPMLKAVPHEQLYKELVLENYEEQRNKSSAGGWMELALYIFSGIILILMMEQILTLGLYLK